MDAGSATGTLLTQPFRLPGPQLYVNVDIRGSLIVDVLNAEQRIGARSRPLTGDLPRQQVTWEQASLAALGGQTVQLRFSVRSGQLYSYWIR